MDLPRPEDRTLRLFQDEGSTFAATKKRAMLLVDMGLGKTPMASKAVAMNNSRRILIVCPENALEVWAGNGKDIYGDGRAWIEQFTGVQAHVHVLDDEPWNRELEWNKDTLKGELHIYVVVFNTFARDMGMRPKPKVSQKTKIQKPLPRLIRTKQGFDAVIVDEAKRIRSRTSAAFRALQQLFLVYNIPVFIPMTGTPGIGPENFWTMFNLIDHKKFSSYWAFVDAFCETDVNAYGKKEIIGLKPSSAPTWYKLLGEYAFVVKEDDPGIADQRPPITRQPLYIDMDPEQQKLYQALKNDMIALCEKSDDLIVAENSFTMALRLRQLLICPQIILPNSTPGAAIVDLRERILNQDFKLPTVIFCPFTKAFEPFKRYLNEKITSNMIHTLQSGDSIGDTIGRWRRSQGVILVSILYAQAFSLEPAQKGFFIGQDWDPDNNRQAEKRLHRLTTINPINIYYYVHKKTIEHGIVNTLNIKQDKINITTPKNFREFVRSLQ